MIEPSDTNPCFGCGGANPHGMHLAFDRDDARQRVTGRFRIGPDFQGGGGFLHGGIIATVLDEVMSKVSGFSGVRAVTAELTVEFLKPIHVDQEILVEGFLARRDGRRRGRPGRRLVEPGVSLYHEGEIRSATGALLARGRGRFVVVDPERYRESAGVI
jgi:acyl-coenzyme A thioesterase PaaI-like protein